MFTQATIKDVARAAGVHFTTVSMALRGHPAIAVNTRLRIENIANLIGYQRNQVFSALSRQRKKQEHSAPIPTLLYLGRVMSDVEFFKMSHHEQLVAGATQEATALGYNLKSRIVGPSDIQPEKLQAHLARSSAVGLIIGAWDPTLAVPLVDWGRIPTVKIDSRTVSTPQMPFVSFDQMKAVLDSFRQVQARGYKRIGLALGEKDEDATDGLHLSGWMIAQEEFPKLPRIPPLFFPPRATFHDVLPLIDAWTRKHRVDVVLSNWTSTPEMLKAVGYWPVGFVSLCRQKDQTEMAGIVPNFDLVGQRAISLLGGIINTSPTKPSVSLLSSYVEGTWHDGPSIKNQG